MRERGRGRRRGIAIGAIVATLALAAPGFLAPAGAGTGAANQAGAQSRPGARVEFVAKRRPHKVRLRRMSAARRKSLLTRYIRTHPGVVAAHRSKPGITLATKVRAKAHHTTRTTRKTRIKKPGRRAKARAHPKKGKKKKKKKKSSSGFTLHRALIVLIALAAGGLALFLISSSVRNGPRARVRARERSRQRPLPTR